MRYFPTINGGFKPESIEVSLEEENVSGHSSEIAW